MLIEILGYWDIEVPARGVSDISERCE